MSFNDATEYMTRFFRSRQPLYEEMMRDVGSSHYPPAFKGESYIIQSIRNIVHNVSDNYWDLSVPEGYASPKLVVDALAKLRDFADHQLGEIDRINKEMGSIWVDPVSYAHRINFEVREAIIHALSLLEEQEAASLVTPLQRLKHLASRLRRVERQLQQRRNEGGKPRSTLTVSDEYDVQDLLHAVLKIEFDDIRPEEWCPSYAGSSKRLDFLLKTESIVVEVKKTRHGLGQKEVGEQLVIDIANYRQHHECKHLFCLIWDAEHRIQNPQGLRDDLEKSNPDFVTVVII